MAHCAQASRRLLNDWVLDKILGFAARLDA